MDARSDSSQWYVWNKNKWIWVFLLSLRGESWWESLQMPRPNTSNKGSLFFHRWTERKNTLKIFSLKKNKTKWMTERKTVELYCTVWWGTSELNNHNQFAIFLGKGHNYVIVIVKAEEFRKLRTIICCNYGSPLPLLTLQPDTAACNAHYIPNALAVHI